MTHMTYSQLINFTSTMTTDELVKFNHDLVGIIKHRRKMEAKDMRRELSLGDVVNVDGHGTGIVKKIMRTRALVEMNGVSYKVPMNMLTHKA